MKPDVLIVGAGPAGAVLAGLLAGRGVRVLLVDKARFPRPKPCGECLNPGAVAALRRLGLHGEVAPLRPPALRGWRLTLGPWTHDLTYPRGLEGCVVDRPRLDHALLGWAAARGACVAEGARVSDLVAEGGRVAGVRLSSGRHLEAGLVVGADGLRSVVLRRLGLAGPARTQPRVALTAHWAGVPGLCDRGEIHLCGRLVCGIAPVGPGEANVVLVLPGQMARELAGAGPAAGPAPGGVPGLLTQSTLLDRFPGLRERFAAARPVGPVLATGPFDRPVRAVTAPGALLVGDAAGYFDPLTGQGIYRALRSAELAFPAIRGALEGREDEAFASYQGRIDSEFGPATRRQRLIDTLVRRPALLALGLGLLTRIPPAGARLMGLVGDCDTPEVAEGAMAP
jgi:flavin-dependent dehydrogenase